MSNGMVSWKREDAAVSPEPPSPIAGDKRSKCRCADCGKIIELPLQWRPIPEFVVSNAPEILRCRACDGEDEAAFREGCIRERITRMRSRRSLWLADRRRMGLV